MKKTIIIAAGVIAIVFCILKPTIKDYIEYKKAEDDLIVQYDLNIQNIKQFTLELDSITNKLKIKQ